MELIKLLGIVIVIVGFAIKLDPILIVVLASVVTALVGGLGVDGMLSTLGTSFVSNRSMAIFILIMIVVGTLERNGMKEAATKLISKVTSATAGTVIGAYGVMRSFFAAFNISFGGVAGFVRPIIMPMAVGTVESSGKKIDKNYEEKIKGMASGMENVAWFFFQVLFVGGPGALLVQSSLKSLGYQVDLLGLAKVEIPVAVFALIVAIVYYYLVDRRYLKNHHNGIAVDSTQVSSNEALSEDNIVRK